MPILAVWSLPGAMDRTFLLYMPNSGDLSHFGPSGNAAYVQKYCSVRKRRKPRQSKPIRASTWGNVPPAPCPEMPFQIFGIFSF